MKLYKLFLKNNECYQVGKTMKTIKGIMVHSTGANNVRLKRYVGPDDGRLGVNNNNNHWNQWRPDGRQVCVHAFIGELQNGSIATYQTLPWNMRAWHAGGSANDSYIGFEICEDNLKDPSYFKKVYNEAVELTAHLCEEYNLDPLGKNVIICHSEGAKLKIASAHGDVMHWFPKHGKSMDTFRQDVAKVLGKVVVTAPVVETTTKPTTPAPVSTGVFKVNDIVKFTGNMQYTSAYSKSGTHAKTSLVKITSIASGGTHKYHVRAVDANGNFVKGSVYGWVDAQYLHSNVPQTYRVRVTSKNLNIRSGPNTSSSIVGQIKDQGVYTIIETSGTWGKLKSEAGWISLNYTKKV